MNKLFSYMLITLLVGSTACKRKSFKHNIQHKVDVNKSKVDSIQSINTYNVIEQDKLSPYKEKDSLLTNLKKKWKDEDVRALERICETSDGDLSEGLGDDMMILFYSNLKDVTQHLMNHPNTCLKKSLIFGLSAYYAPYDKNDRENQVLKNRQRILIKADSAKLPQREIQFIKRLLMDVNPNILD